MLDVGEGGFLFSVRPPTTSTFEDTSLCCGITISPVPTALRVTGLSYLVIGGRFVACGGAGKWGMPSYQTACLIPAMCGVSFRVRTPGH